MERSRREAHDLAGEAVIAHAELAASAAAGRAGIARADAMAAASRPPAAGFPAPPSPMRWGWRRAAGFALARRMYTPQYLRLYARFLAHRLRHPHVEMGGMVFFGRGVELFARRGHGRLQIGPWCWVGNGTQLRVHEGDLRLAPKVVIGAGNAVNVYLDVEIGQGSLLSDGIYIADFDHRYDRVDVPIRKQGIAKAPTRIGEDVWVGEKVSILRGADIGSGSVIGSQSLVKGAIPPFSVAVGSPARVIASRLPKGMTAEEALDLQRRGGTIPGDPLA